MTRPLQWGMPETPSLSGAQLVLIVHDDVGVSEALALALEAIGAVPVQVNRTSDARMVIRGAPGLTAVVSRCVLDLDGEETLLVWVGRQRPAVALIGVCSDPGHAHDDFPGWCQFFGAPFDGQDLKRALIEARLSAFESSSAP